MNKYNLTENQVIEVLKNLIELESPSNDKKLNDKLCDYIEGLFTDFSKVTRIKKEYIGDILKIEYGESEDQILILCHMDTVWNEGEILKRPFTVTDKKIIGPGTHDMKYGIAQVYFALKILNEKNIKLGYKIVVLINSDEEIGSTHSRENIESEAIKSDCVFVLEATGTNGAIKTERKGFATFSIKSYGRASHAGGEHHEGSSAIREIAHHILEIEKLTNYEEGITTNVGVISGGSKINIVPDFAQIDLECRFHTLKQYEILREYFQNIKAKSSRNKVVVTEGVSRLALEKTDRSRKLFKYASNIGAKMGLIIGEVSVGGVSDGNLTAHLGIPTIDGLGPVGHGSHAIDEYIDRDCLVERVIYLHNIITNYPLGKI